MILPDINVLVYAFRADSPEHDVYAPWLEGVVAGSGSIALCDLVLSGFVRIVTNPRVADPPAPTAVALDFVRWLIEAPAAHWLPSGSSTWDRFAALADDRAVRGNLVPDAYLAALCISNGVRLATADRGFARYPGLRWFDPATAVPG